MTRKHNKQNINKKTRKNNKQNIKGGSIFSSNNKTTNEFKLKNIINIHNNIGKQFANSEIKVKSKNNSVKISGHYAKGPIFFSDASIKFKNNGTTKIKIPVVGKLLINSNYNLHIKDISTKIYSLFKGNDNDLIDKKIKQYFPEFIKIVKPHIAIIKNNPKKFKYILYKALQKPDGKKLISLLKGLFNSNNQFHQTIELQLDMFIMQSLNILENILKDINVTNNNLTREIKDTDKIHLENLKPNKFENMVNPIVSIFQLVTSQIK
jgi:hypothetical protein